MNIRRLILFSYGTKSTILGFCLLFIGIHYYLRANNIYNPKTGRWVRVLKKTASIDKYNTNGLTPLMNAADKLDFDTIITLLQQGADPNLQSKAMVFDSQSQKSVPSGMTALHYAAIRAAAPSSPQVFEALLANGADPNIKEDVYGNAALLLLPNNIANMTLAQKLVSLLLRYGGDINIQNKTGNTVLHMAVENNAILAWMKMVRDYFAPFFNMAIKNKRGMTPYTYAKFMGKVDTANPKNTTLFTQKVKMPSSGERTKLGYTGLMIAAINGDEKLAKNLLLFNGAKPNEISGGELKQTALHLACIHQKLPVVKLLIAQGANIQQKDAFGNTPLHVTIMGHEPTLQAAIFSYLMKHKADINAKNKVGNTPFHLAVVENEDDFITFVLKNYSKKINYGIKNNNYMTALDLAKKLNYTTLVTKIERAQSS